VVAQRLAPFKASGALPPFPLGCPFTEEELALGKALRKLKALTETPLGLAQLVWRVATTGLRAEDAPLMARMDLAAPQSVKERLSRRLVSAALRL
jgi:hypothetical protein